MPHTQKRCIINASFTTSPSEPDEQQLSLPLVYFLQYKLNVFCLTCCCVVVKMVRVH